MSKNKVLVISLIILLIVMILPFSIVYAQQKAEFNIDSKDCKKGDTITLKIDMLNAVSFVAGNFTVKYDSTSLDFVSYEYGEVLRTNYMITIHPVEDEGKINIGYIARLDAGTNLVKAGNVLTLKFKVKDDSKQINYVDFSCDTFKEKDGTDISYHTNRGIVDIHIPIKDVKLDKNNLDLLVNESEQLNMSIEPKNTTENTNVTWLSSNEKVAIVNDGIVTAVGEGKATIIAKVGDIVTNCEVNVVDLNNLINNCTLDKNNVEIDVGEATTISVLNFPNEYKEKIDFFWSSSDESVAYVDNTGKVIARTPGKASITLNINGQKKDCLVIVKSDKYELGDLDRNGVIDANDASIALELFKTGNYSNEDISIGDMDNNGIIDTNDASLIINIYKSK